jgi:hypothetical protein
MLEMCNTETLYTNDQKYKVEQISLTKEPNKAVIFLVNEKPYCYCKVNKDLHMKI